MPLLILRGPGPARRVELRFVLPARLVLVFDVDQLKLRAAWGQAGNPPDPFVADRTYTAGATSTGDAIVNLLRPSSYGNPDLKAETGSELELGTYLHVSL